MRTWRVIHHPNSLEDAKSLFTAMLAAEGYTVVGAAKADWQDNLFEDALDAIVHGRIRKTRQATE